VVREEWQITPPYVDLEGYFFSADTIEELAGKLTGNKHQWRPMPGATLRETVERYNSFVNSGMDQDFGKVAPQYKIQAPPFYAAWATPCPTESFSGLRINVSGQVKDMKGRVIPGLYAAGASASGIRMHGLAKGLLFGRLAGIHAATRTV
jgi:succinate dehydrogenase/fumarate reductase flavoprotein subunit